MRSNDPLRHGPPARIVRRGAGLLELVVVLALVGLFGGLGVRGLAPLRDRWGVVGARDALAQLIREARGRAVARAGSRVVVSAVRGDATLESGGVALRTVDLAREFGVTIDLGGRTEARLVFDPAGVGRMASRTLVLVRGGSRDRLVISTYGRVR